MNILKGCFIAAMAWLFQSCFDSDDHIFDDTEATEISIEATLATSSTQVMQSVKADTFNIEDTIFFQATIIPNKNIRAQDYHWLMDGEYCSSEYSFKKQISEPGYHKFTFVLKDNFGDIHYDSLKVWISDIPSLNDSLFTPAQGTQAFDPYESIYFTWKASTKGIRLAHQFHFTLSEQRFANSKTNFKEIDTILNEPYFIFHNKLNPLKKYNWTVQAFNEYGFASEEKIESHFYTKGFPGEGSLQAIINISQEEAIPVRLSLQNINDSNKIFNFDFDISKSDNEVSLGAIHAGTYKLTLQSDFSDFGTIQKEVKVNDGFVTLLDNIKYIDTIPPYIASISNNDTLDFADTLKFILKDKGGELIHKNITVSLEDEPILDRFYKDSILTVILKEKDKSWAYRILSIVARDGSKNTTTKSFYISPSIFWFTTNNDTTIANDESLIFFIKDNNPFDFKVDSIKFVNESKNETIVSIAGPNKESFSAELEATFFREEQTIKSIIIYTNGMIQSKKWKLHVTQAKTKEDE